MPRRPELRGVQPVLRDDVEETLKRRVLFFDDFDKSKWTVLPWFVTSGIATIALDAVVGLVSTVGQVMKFVSGASAATSSEMHRYFTKQPAATSYLFGGRFHVADASNPTNVGLYLGFRDGTNWVRGKLLVTLATGVVAWQDSAGAHNTLVTQALQASPTRARWHTFQIQVNFLTGLYERVVFDGVDYTSVVAGKLLRSSADASTPNFLDFAIDCTETAVAGAMYFDELYGAWV